MGTPEARLELLLSTAVETLVTACLRLACDDHAGALVGIEAAQNIINDVKLELVVA